MRAAGSSAASTKKRKVGDRGERGKKRRSLKGSESKKEGGGGEGKEKRGRRIRGRKKMEEEKEKMSELEQVYVKENAETMEEFIRLKTEKEKLLADKQEERGDIADHDGQGRRICGNKILEFDAHAPESPFRLP